MTEGFQKIELPISSEQKQKTEKKKTSSIAKYLLLFFVVLFLFITSSSLILFFPAKNLYFSFQKTGKTALEAYTAAKNQDIGQTQEKLKELKDNINSVEKDLSKFSFFKYVPFVGAYEKDAGHLVRAGKAGVEAADIAVNSLVPYAELLGLKGKSTFVSGTADDRIKMAVETLDKMTPKLEEVAQKINIVGQELDQVDPKRYPEKIRTFTVRNKLQTAKDLFSQTAKLFVNAQPLLRKFPELMGTQKSKTYLILFQNDAELRATGGFITAYGLFKVDKGKMQVIKADDIYKLDEAKRKKYPVPDPIKKYHMNVSNFELRDSNLSPDFAISMKEFETMLKESVPDFPQFDGIIALDTHVLANTIKILGDFNVYGRVFSAEIDKRCDCPKAVYELEDYSTRPVAYVREERKDIIGVLLYQIMQRALGISPSKYWGRLSQMFLEEARQKHVLFYFHDMDAQKGIEALNFGGRILPFDGDYLHISDVNFAGAKSNMFVRSSVKQDISLGSDGSITKTLTITYKNPAPPSNCNLEAGQLCLNGILRNWLRIYVPSGSQLIEFVGSEKETGTYEEIGKTVFEGFFTVKPQGTTEVKIRYKLPLKIKKGEQYKLLIQKQPGTDEPDYTILRDNKLIEQLKLLTDKDITIKF